MFDIFDNCNTIATKINESLGLSDYAMVSTKHTENIEHTPYSEQRPNDSHCAVEFLQATLNSTSWEQDEAVYSPYTMLFTVTFYGKNAYNNALLFSSKAEQKYYECLQLSDVSTVQQIAEDNITHWVEQCFLQLTFNTIIVDKDIAEENYYNDCINIKLNDKTPEASNDNIDVKLCRC